jgi:GT2 family glycosyltransferase
MTAPELGAHRVSVIICAYTLDRWQDLLNAVQSCCEQTVPPLEVVVVVDNNDELRRRAEAALPDARVVANHHGPGLSGGRNSGADVADGSILLFLDDDAVASPRWLEEHLAGFGHENVLGVGGEVVPMWRAEMPAWLPSELYWVVGCTYTGMPETPGAIRNPIGANMSIRADVFAAAGGFQQELGRLDTGKRAITGTADETEFCIRVLRSYPDGEWMYRPDARVAHVVPAERATWRHFRDRCRLEGGSKAVLVRLSGQQAGLASERAYVRRVLPRAVVRELRSAVAGRPAGFVRAAVIVAGLWITALTYVRALALLAAGRGQRYVS